MSREFGGKTEFVNERTVAFRVANPRFIKRSFASFMRLDYEKNIFDKSVDGFELSHIISEISADADVK